MLADLIPEKFFEQFIEQDMIWCLWLVAAGALIPLVFGADRAVSSAVKLAGALGMSTVLIGATVVSLGTTSPEAFVSVTAAFKGKPGLALGNGVGSIICDTGLVFGICCCIQRLPKDRFILKRHGWIQIGSAAVLVAVVAIPALILGTTEGIIITRLCGFIFLGGLVGYMAISVKWARENPEIIDDSQIKKKKPQTPLGILLSVLMLLVGLALVIVGSELLVGSAGRICLYYHVPESILAVTLVAFGTSLPELATAIAAIVKGHPGLMVGNIIGADVLNVLFVIGASASASELEVPGEFFYMHLPALMIILVFFRIAGLRKAEEFSRWEGAVLLGMFIAYYAMMVMKVTEVGPFA